MVSARAGTAAKTAAKTRSAQRRAVSRPFLTGNPRGAAARGGLFCARRTAIRSARDFKILDLERPIRARLKFGTPQTSRSHPNRSRKRTEYALSRSNMTCEPFFSEWCLSGGFNSTCFPEQVHQRRAPEFASGSPQDFPRRVGQLGGSLHRRPKRGRRRASAAVPRIPRRDGRSALSRGRVAGTRFDDVRDHLPVHRLRRPSPIGCCGKIGVRARLESADRRTVATRRQPAARAPRPDMHHVGRGIQPASPSWRSQWVAKRLHRSSGSQRLICKLS